LIEEQGITSTASGIETVSLPITYSNTNYNLQVEVAETNSSSSLSGGQFWQNNIYAVTENSFILSKLLHYNGSGNTYSTNARCWRTVGY